MFKQKYRFEIDRKNKIITLMPRRRDIVIAVALTAVSCVVSLVVAIAASE